MDTIILGLLMFNNMTIYELNQSFQSGLSLIYSASYGSLQNGVKKLLTSDYITFNELIENGRNKKIYRLTEKGRAAFYEWMQLPIESNKLETVILSKIYFLGLIESKESKVMILEDIVAKAKGVESQLSEYQKELNNYKLPPEALQIAYFQFKTLDYGIMSHRAAITWLEALYDSVVNDTTP